MVALAQQAEQRIVDPQVMGSTPIGHPNSTLDGYRRRSKPIDGQAMDGNFRMC